MAGEVNRFLGMETIDLEVSKFAIDFIERNVKADKPFFCWWNSTRMHINTHLRAESQATRDAVESSMPHAASARCHTRDW